VPAAGGLPPIGRGQAAGPESPSSPAPRPARPGPGPEPPGAPWRALDQLPATGVALRFASPEGSPLHHSNFRRRTWLPAVSATGLTGTHLYDLRHAGNTFTANAGANLRELTDRMGHSTTRAALIYLHGEDQRQQAIADAVGDMARKALRERPRRRSESQ
jgi:hypothetical protein